MTHDKHRYEFNKHRYEIMKNIEKEKKKMMKMMNKLNNQEMANVAGGVGMPLDLVKEGCPVHGHHHDYKPTGESRKTDAWFYNTEEQYKCACGKSYWEAGYFSIRKYE